MVYHATEAHRMACQYANEMTDIEYPDVARASDTSDSHEYWLKMYDEKILEQMKKSVMEENNNG
ncbi:hypothetical protein EVB32_123 [Rhizobium phage RHph_TM39]|uniref:Uncharacterized protein n=2 Tax=Cuauhnahuacvirus TaxID=3044696 RepID=A0A7S5UYT8_9CAUD|nr:hypothetical protein PQC16_gp123 [Rhizobium phage RHph_TM30]YP_010671274.1 hypothetical protein PQC17_gp125 [Rhizobium phage RHph_Y65]QIG71594.1 hypothetical protein EVB94_123 [Rhizobium phage RHph_TM40]QIG71957.1 hypothetical protein EVB95_123 [Rhizobium phage RHph_TM2_3B]QIG72319.1 hypothetical protein EVB96_123 [Rhizobium phage RHph_TM3_3_6]QIG77111.1 hypothetical protein EVB32_123 [Rhizobium phage RHph_TM39]QIG71230.1 hypothetical protein EVB93_123 [Rhizobium phage RHph_TM30]